MIKKKQFRSTSENKITNCYTGKNIRVKCCGNRKSFEMCTNEQCKQNSKFTCTLKVCECQYQHEYCPKINLSKLVEMIKQKQLRTINIRDLIDSTINQLIDQLIQFRQTTISQVKTQMRFSQLLQVEKSLMKQLYQPEKSQLLPELKDLSIIWKICNDRDNKERELFKKTETILIDLKDEMDRNIKNTISLLNEIIENQREKLKVQCLLAKQNPQVYSSIKQSSIIQTMDTESLFKLFPKPIKAINLLYKASENSFKLTKISELNGQMNNTLILCQSNQGKIAGGYTSLHYYRNQLTLKWNLVSTRSKDSFIFSSIKNQKFKLEDKNSIICLHNNKGQLHLSFGSVYDEESASPMTNSKLRSNRLLENEKCKLERKSSCSEFNKQDSSQYQLSECQIWKVVMK